MVIIIFSWKRLYLTERLTMQQVGEQFGLSRQRVQHILKVLGVKSFSPLAGRKTGPKIALEAGELYQLDIVDRLPLYKVAAKLIVSRHVVDCELERLGFPRQRPTQAHTRRKWLEMDGLAIGDSFKATLPDKRHISNEIYFASIPPRNQDLNNPNQPRLRSQHSC